MQFCTLSRMFLMACCAGVCSSLVASDLRHMRGAQAPPGAGKTTTLPLALLLHAPSYLSGGKKILVLEPRIVAAK